jgi:hypothetical protein
MVFLLFLIFIMDNSHPVHFLTIGFVLMEILHYFEYHGSNAQSKLHSYFCLIYSIIDD